MPTRCIDYPNTGGISKAKRGDPGVNDRVESGPVKFGDDWTGLFLRGDDAFGMAHDMKSLVDWYKNLSDSDKTRAIELGFPRIPLFSLNHYIAMILEEVVEK